MAAKAFLQDKATRILFGKPMKKTVQFGVHKDVTDLNTTMKA
jgi:hypothetical protein